MHHALHAQPGILPAPPKAGRFLHFDLVEPIRAGDAVERLKTWPVDDRVVVGLGASFAAALGHRVPGLRPFPCLTAPGVPLPSTDHAIWAFVRGEDAGESLHVGAQLRRLLGDAVLLREEVASFVHHGGRDLSGYEDGTENPKGDGAVAAAILSGAGPGLDGSSFVATQRWVHDLARFAAWPPEERDAAIGRARETNEELGDAPPSAHVKRSAQESFAPAAFMLRRSMPWGDVERHGLYFVAFGHSFDAFERVLRHMVGEDDGVVDALFRFSRPESGGYHWCPPVREGRLDLRALGA